MFGKTMCVGICAAVMGIGPVQAKDIAFTGGVDGTGTDLAAAANWDGGALPTADDTGVVAVGNQGGGVCSFG